MRKLYSLFAALIVAMFALAQTTPTVTIELVGGKAIVTPTPSDAQVFFAADATENYEFSSSYTEESFVNEVLGFYSEKAKFAAACSQGAKTHCLADWEIKAGKNTLVAAVVAWDDEAGKATCLSEVVRVDTTLAAAPVCDGGGEGGEGEATLTIEAGKYYVSTFMDETKQYLLTTTKGSAVVLPATLYADAETPTAAHEFDFVAVEGQNACFTIKDGNEKFLYLTIPRGSWTPAFAVSEALPEAGAVWKVTLQDTLNHVTIENTDYAGDLHCLNLDGEIGYFFGNEAEGSYTLPVLTKVPGTSTHIQEADTDRQVIKTIENGQLILHINGVRYNILGIAL